MKKNTRRLFVAALTAFAFLLAMGSPAQASSSYYIYWTRPEVKQKAVVLWTVSKLVCLKVPRGLKFTCSTGSAGQAFNYGALHQCAVREQVTITGSSMSYDQATYVYWPYDCLT